MIARVSVGRLGQIKEDWPLAEGTTRPPHCLFPPEGIEEDGWYLVDSVPTFGPGPEAFKGFGFSFPRREPDEWSTDEEWEQYEKDMTAARARLEELQRPLRRTTSEGEWIAFYIYTEDKEKAARAIWADEDAAWKTRYESESDI